MFVSTANNFISMIFKTFDNDLNGLINKVGIFNKSIKNIGRDYKSGNGLFTSLFSGNNVTQKDIQAITAMNQAMKNGSTMARAWYDNMRGCTVAAKEQAKQCLLNKESLSTLTTNLEKTTFAAKADQVALQALATVGNIAAGIIIGMVAGKVLQNIDNYIHRVENAKEALDDFYNSAKESKNKLDSQKEWIEKNGETYEKLSKSVDEYGHSISLTADEFSEYKSLTSEIADMFPNMVKGYNEQDTAILKNKGSVDALTKSYEENVKAYYASIRAKSGDTFSDYKTAISESKKVQENINNLINTKDIIPIKDIYRFVSVYSKGLDKSTKKQLINEMMEMDTTLLGTSIKFDFSKLSEELQQKLLDVYTTAQNTIDAETEKARPILEAYLYSPTSGYDALNEDAKKAAQSFIRNIDGSFYSSFNSDTEMESWFKKNVINSLRDGADSSDLAVRFQTLFALNEEDFDSYQDYVNAVQNTLKAISKMTDKDGKKLFTKDQINSLEMQMGISGHDPDGYVTGQNLIDDVKEKFKDIKGSNNYINELSENELRILYKFEPDENTSLSDLQSFVKEKLNPEAEKATSISTAPLSFSDAWNTLGTTDDDATNSTALETKEKLLELAEAGKLTINAFEDSSIATQFMKDTALSAEEATKKINELVDTTQQLSAMKTGMNAITSAYDEKTDSQDHRVGKDTLNSLRSTLGIDDSWSETDLQVWKDYKDAATDTSISLKDFKKCQDALASSYVNSNNFLSQLDETNKKYYISTLEEMGVENASAIVKQILAQKISQENQDKINLALSTINLSDGIQNNEVLALSNETAWLATASEATKQYYLQKLLANENSLNSSDSIANLKALAEQAGITGTTVAELTTLLQMQRMYESMAANGKSTQALESLKNQIEKQKKVVSKSANQKPKVKVETTKGNSSNNTNTSTPKNNNLEKSKETKQAFDWLERRISVLTDSLDLLKAKIENVFSANKKNSFIDQEIKKTNTLINTYKKQAKVYKKQAKKSAKSKLTVSGEDKERLPKSLQKQIQSGKLKGSRKQWIKTYGEPTAKAIEEYQKYWEQYQKARTNIQSAKTSKRELKIEKHQNKLDKYNALSEKYDAQIKNAATAKDKNDLEDKKIDSTQKSYQQQIQIAKLKYGKNSAQVAELRAEKTSTVRDIKIEKQENIQNEADAYRDVLDAQIETVARAQDKNALLQQERQYIASSYDAQIAIAKLEGNTAKQEELKAQKQKELLDNELAQLQNLSDEQSAQYALHQQQEANADSAKDKNKYEAESRKNLKSQYEYEIQMANKKGDSVEAARLQLELEEKIEDSYKKQLENIREEYNLIIGLNNARKSSIDSEIAALQANGYGIATAMYEQKIALDKESYQNALNKIDLLTREMSNLSGDALEQAKIDLESDKQEAWGFQQAIAEAQQTINEINLSKFERLRTLLKYNANNLEYMQNILSHSDFTLSDNGNGGLTMEGLSNMALNFAQISNNKEQIDNLYAQIAEKQRQLNSGEYTGPGDQIAEEIDALIQEAHDLESANYDLGESIKEAVIDSLNSLSDALDENISKYKEALQKQKDLYDYRRKITDQLKSIASLEKQLAALQGSNTEEARAKIQKLQLELETEQQNLEDMEYDKYIQDQEEMLDNVSEDFQDFIADVADMSVLDICTGMKEAISDNLSGIKTSIQNALNESTTIGSLATSIPELTEALNGIDYAGKVNTSVDENGNVHYEYTDDNANKIDITVDNNDNPGTVTSVSVNGEKIDIPKKEVLNTDKDINREEERMRNAVKYFLNNAASYFEGASSRMSSDPLNQYIYSNYKKMLDPEQEDMLLKNLGIDGDSSDRNALSKAVSKLKELGFSQGGVASELNKVALANGDDGWATLKRGESILTPEQTAQFRKLTKNSIPINSFVDTLKIEPNYPERNKTGDSSVNIDNISVEAHLDGSNVVDADSFIKTLHNPKVLKEVSNGVSSQIGTTMSNRLSSF